MSGSLQLNEEKEPKRGETSHEVLYQVQSSPWRQCQDSWHRPRLCHIAGDAGRFVHPPPTEVQCLPATVAAGPGQSVAADALLSPHPLTPFRPAPPKTCRHRLLQPILPLQPPGSGPWRNATLHLENMACAGQHSGTGTWGKHCPTQSSSSVMASIYLACISPANWCHIAGTRPSPCGASHRRRRVCSCMGSLSSR